MSTFKGSDGCTDIILDFIAGGVPGNQIGESGGNYDAVIGEPHAHDDLARKPLSEIYRMMAHLLVLGRPSTAVGRYQIIRRTLRPLQAALRLPDGELFTPALQDRLAVRLLVGRGYRTWWRGGMTNEEFAHGLSCEWASLPDPERDGRSHYDGVGANHASTTLAHVYSALERARVAQPKAAPRLSLMAPEPRGEPT